MEFHPQKCSIMRISRARIARIFQYHLKGVSLAEEQSSKYLGVDLQSNLSWKNHISRITKKSNNMLGFLHRNLWQVSEETKAQTYFTMVRSNLDYCSTIWSTEDLHVLSPIDTGTPAVSPTCLTISAGSHMKREEVNCS